MREQKRKDQPPTGLCILKLTSGARMMGCQRLNKTISTIANCTTGRNEGS